MERIIWRNLESNKNLFNQAAKSGAFIIFDTETTGLSAKDAQVIEFAGYKCHYKNDVGFVKDEVFHQYIKPYEPVTEEITAINGITNEMLENCPEEHECFQRIRDFLGDSPVLGAYNSGFDIKMMNAMYERNGATLKVGLEVDLLKIAKDIFCDTKTKDHKLATIANAYGVEEGIKFHSAIDDVEVLLRVTNKMIFDMQKNGVDKKGKQLEKVTVYQTRYYEGYRGNSRIYVYTSKGVLYYELMKDTWSANDNRLDITSLDMKDVESQVIEKNNCSDWDSLKKKIREEGKKS